MRFDLERLEQPPAGDGAPLLLPLDVIDEDPAQPRREFDEVALRELATTIAERGVRQPVSVRRHAGAPGRWLLNFGARRLRASKLAGKTEIPAFIDETADTYDQVIENEQREPLQPLELALFVQRRLAAGESQAEIARRMGKGRSYVTYATALIDAPDWLLDAYREGRCRGLRELYELRRLHGEDAATAHEALASQSTPITRERIGALREALHSGRRDRRAAARREDLAATEDTGLPQPTTAKRRVHRPMLAVELDGSIFELVTEQVPAENGEVFIRSLLEQHMRKVLASRLRLLGFAAR